MARILGISPGTKAVGFAVLENGKLTEWKIETFKGRWSQEKLLVITSCIKQYAEQYSVQVVAVKLPDALPTSHAFIQIVGTVNAYCERTGLHVMYYMLSDLKKHYCPGKKNNKMQLIDCITNYHPELLPEWQKERHNQNSYYGKLFEAIAAARLADRQL